VGFAFLSSSRRTLASEASNDCANQSRNIGVVMSRSMRKTPVFGITKCDSEKQDKRFANRCVRRAARLAIEVERPTFDGEAFCWKCLGTGDNPEPPGGGCPSCHTPLGMEVILEREEAPLVRELSSVWSFGKDGRRYRRHATSVDMRK
jgi:hypothetical protein